MSEHGSNKAILAALAANLGIAITKFVAFLITGSSSMLAESVHSVADSGNQVLLLIGRTRARREETEQHQFGFGAERGENSARAVAVPAPLAHRARTRGLAGGGIAGLADQQDGDIVPDRIGEPAVSAGADELAGFIVGAQRRVAFRAGEDLKQPVVDVHRFSIAGRDRGHAVRH